MVASVEMKEGGSFGLAHRNGIAGQVAFVISILAAIALFWPGFVDLVDAWATPEYSHGPIIPLISTFLMLREMRAMPPTSKPITDRWPGVALALMGLLVGVLGNLASIGQIVTYGFMIWVAGVVLTLFGARRGFMFWPALLHLVFMLPLPQFIYWEVSSYLQFISSEIGVALIRLVGVPVFLDGNIIDLGIYKLQVAEACSGLRYLFPMLSFSYVFGVLYNGPKWHKVLLLLSAAPITVLMNSFRIGMIGVLVDNYGIEHAEGFLHTFEGWVIFLACVLILFGEAMVLQRLTRDPRPLSETLDIEFDGLVTQLRRFEDIMPSKAIIAVAVLSVGVTAAWYAAPVAEHVRPQRDPLVLFPLDIGSWEGRPHTMLDPQIEAVLGADDYFGAVYLSDEQPAQVDLFMAYYHNQTDGDGIHSPEVCIPAGGWEVSGWERRSITLENGEVFNVVQAVIQKGLQRQLVYFWFDLRGKRINGEYEAKFVNVLDSAKMGRSDGALVRLITPLGQEESPDQAGARLQAFMLTLSDKLPRFIPH